MPSRVLIYGLLGVLLAYGALYAFDASPAAWWSLTVLFVFAVIGGAGVFRASRKL